MASSDTTWPPLVVIGPTASGKSSLAIALAQKIGTAEIISADAMAVYKEMNIGTAKVSTEEQQGIPHHLIDTATVADGFTVSEFQQLAYNTLADLESRSKIPIIVGGTGLYVRSVVDEYTMPPNYPDIRAKLETQTDSIKLWSQLKELDPEAAEKMEPTNHRRIVRALEVVIGSGEKFSSFGPGVNSYSPTKYLQVGLEIDRAVLDQRIEERFDFQMENGFLEEVEQLAKQKLSPTALQALGYKELLAHLNGESSLEEAVETAKLRTKRFARRQQRWFRRDPRIKWFEAPDEAVIEKVYKYWQENKSKIS